MKFGTLPPLTLSVSAALLTAQTKQPNMVVILADDQGWGDLSLHGNRDLKTPNIDSIAKEGANFHRFFVQPVCAPTRAEFLTGRFFPEQASVASQPATSG